MQEKQTPRRFRWMIGLPPSLGLYKNIIRHHEEARVSQALTLDEMGILAGTDKSSIEHDYLRHYEALFSEWRDAPINIIEIGIASGASLKIWPQFFRNATIIGIDINPACARFAGDRVVVRIGSQGDRDFLSGVCREFPPTIVIDDGSHRADHNRFTFEVVFPQLLSRGLYVIEDLFVHFGPAAGEWSGAGGKPPHDMINDISNKLLAGTNGWRPDATLDALAREIDRVVTIPRATVFRKIDLDARPAWETNWPLVEKSDNWQNWVSMANLIDRKGGPAALAVAAAQKAVDAQPNNPVTRGRLAWMLYRAGRKAEAAAEVALVVSKSGGWDKVEPARRRTLERIAAECREPRNIAGS